MISVHITCTSKGVTRRHAAVSIHVQIQQVSTGRSSQGAVDTSSTEKRIQCSLSCYTVL